MKLSSVQQLTLVAAVTAFLCAPGHAFKAVAAGDDDHGWIVLKASDYAKNAKPGTKMKAFYQPGMSVDDAKELCKKNNAVLANLHDVIAIRTHQYFPVQAHIVAHKDVCPILDKETGYAIYRECGAKADHAICERPAN
ncbi:hypothetical protein Q1695_009463 [Nippostrongylus brasiliensis]|nr:hypothetical protein Q1695_009463 [Nippostrongylus brasiliensis]